MWRSRAPGIIRHLYCPPRVGVVIGHGVNRSSLFFRHDSLVSVGLCNSVITYRLCLTAFKLGFVARTFSTATMAQRSQTAVLDDFSSRGHVRIPHYHLRLAPRFLLWMATFKFYPTADSQISVNDAVFTLAISERFGGPRHRTLSGDTAYYLGTIPMVFEHPMSLGYRASASAALLRALHFTLHSTLRAHIDICNLVIIFHLLGWL
ncbi:hypothetical protein EXIGLDRAFT_843156 [Exidia glandulosa HHB12029]|uniref:Uncharacterized protein n=1 Tax=Exidia glandulosa HHB12029 TaxID=1314781 RepID=A0A165CUV8_EXIGL|nr:hypothetical protein EXIGLDRAFT_843156 [Exidia glandulosa HHB12029]